MAGFTREQFAGLSPEQVAAMLGGQQPMPLAPPPQQPMPPQTMSMLSPNPVMPQTPPAPPVTDAGGGMPGPDFAGTPGAAPAMSMRDQLAAAMLGQQPQTIGNFYVDPRSRAMLYNDPASGAAYSPGSRGFANAYQQMLGDGGGDAGFGGSVGAGSTTGVSGTGDLGGTGPGSTSGPGPGGPSTSGPAPGGSNVGPGLSGPTGQDIVDDAAAPPPGLTAQDVVNTDFGALGGNAPAFGNIGADIENTSGAAPYGPTGGVGLGSQGVQGTGIQGAPVGGFGTSPQGAAPYGTPTPGDVPAYGGRGFGVEDIYGVGPQGSIPQSALDAYAAVGPQGLAAIHGAMQNSEEYGWGFDPSAYGISPEGMAALDAAFGEDAFGGGGFGGYGGWGDWGDWGDEGDDDGESGGGGYGDDDDGDDGDGDDD
jgi:hypothetical protein